MATDSIPALIPSAETIGWYYNQPVSTGKGQKPFKAELMRETFGLLFLVAACGLTWAQTALFSGGTSGDVIVIMFALTLIAYISAYAGSGGRTNKIMKRVLTFIGGIQALVMLVIMALSITGYFLQISTQGPGFYILFAYAIGFGIYAAVLGGLTSQFEL